MGEMIPIEQGGIRHISTAAPAAGIEIVIALPVRVRWRLISLLVLLTTDATVANRVIHLSITDGGIEVVRFATMQVITASTPRTCIFSAVERHNLSVTGGIMSGQIPLNLLLNAQMTIETDTVGMAAGDQYAASELMVREWIEPLA